MADESGAGAERLSLRIESVAYRGPGVAHAEGGAVCFVPETCPGELVEAEVVARRKNFWEARVVRVLEPSPDRLAEPDCRVWTVDGFVKTPGCVYDHARHEAEVDWKNGQLRGFLERQAAIAGAGERLEAPFVSPRSLHYRNKTTMHSARSAAGRQILGYVGDDNRTVVDVPSCPLSERAIDDELAAIRNDPAFWRYVGAGSQVVLRWTPDDGVATWVDRPAVRGAAPERDRLPDLTERTPVLGRLRVPARGFWQMNGEVGGALVSAVTDLLRAEAPARFADLYCGVGVFGLSAAKAGVPFVVGADSGRDVVRAAAANAREHGLDGRARFACADVAAAADRLLADCAGPGAAALVDPPRAGLDPRVVRALLAHRPHLLLYVSCAPDTLARDLRLLCAPGSGYALRSARLFDMFPRTAHFETLCVLERKSAG